MLPHRLIPAIALAVTLSLATACAEPDDGASTSAATDRSTTAGSTTTTTEPVVSQRPFTVDHDERTFERTAADGTDRSLLTEVWVPRGDGPFPLIAFAHGNDGHPRKFHQLFEAWATAGYAVVAPRFPVSADDADRDLAASIADGPEQNLDLEFVVQQVLAESAAPGDPLEGQIDPDLLAVAGLSLGGGTALQSSYTDCCPTLQPKLVIAFSPVPYATSQPADAPPLLLMHGAADRTLPYSGSRDYFDTALNPRWFVTMTNGSHADPYEDSPSEYDDLVRTVSIDFLDQFVLGDADGVSRAEATVAASGAATIESAGGSGG